MVKGLHVVVGIAWLVASIVFVVRPASGWWAVLGCAVASLSYVPVGTLMSIVVVALLLTPPLRSML